MRRPPRKALRHWRSCLSAPGAVLLLRREAKNSRAVGCAAEAALAGLPARKDWSTQAPEAASPVGRGQVTEEGRSEGAVGGARVTLCVSGLVV